IVLAPLTRSRSYGNVPQPFAILYYSQRTTNGGFLIAEATGITTHPWNLDEGAGGGMEADSGCRACRGWCLLLPTLALRQDLQTWCIAMSPFAIHSRSMDGSSRFSLSLSLSLSLVIALLLVLLIEYQPNGEDPVSSTDKAAPPYVHDNGYVDEFSPPRRLRTDEIPGIVDDFRVAARNAIEAGNFSSKIHGAHGFLIEQFLKDSVNDRDDEYGGSLDRRCRFALEVVAAVADEIGADRVGMRLSPFADYGGCRDSDPQALALHLIRQLNQHGVLYCHMVEPEMTVVDGRLRIPHRLLPMRQAFKGTFIVAGGYDREEGNRVVAEGYTDLVAYGRLFLANPDLPKRFELDAQLNAYHRPTFYTHDPVVGYTDYPFLESSASSMR
ncbi:hypothetical protein B296_00005771, partial [Ensete ventricosum]